MPTDPFIPPAQRALTGQSVNPTAGYRALQSRYEGEGANMGGGRSQQLRAYGAMTEYTPTQMPSNIPTQMPALTTPQSVTGNIIDPFSKGTESIGTGASTNLEQAKAFGMKNFVQTGRAAGAGFGQVEVAQYPEYWRGIINYGLTPEASMKAVQNRFGYTLTDAEKQMIDPATGKPYAEAVRTIDNPNILEIDPISAAFTTAEGGIPTEGYITKRGAEKGMGEYGLIGKTGNEIYGYKPKMTKISWSEETPWVQNEHYIDTETGERIDPSKFNFEQALKYGTALEGGTPNLLEMNPAFQQPNPWWKQFMPGLQGLAMASAVVTGGQSAMAAGNAAAAAGSSPLYGAAQSLAGMAPRLAASMALQGGMNEISNYFKPKKYTGFRY